MKLACRFALDDLVGERRIRDAERLAGVGLDLERDGGMRADGARYLADGRFLRGRAPGGPGCGASRPTRALV